MQAILASTMAPKQSSCFSKFHDLFEGKTFLWQAKSKRSPVVFTAETLGRKSVLAQPFTNRRNLTQLMGAVNRKAYH